MRKRELIIFTIVTILVFIIAISLISVSSWNRQQPPSASPSFNPRPSSLTNNISSFSPSPSPIPSPLPILASTKDELIYQLPFQGDTFNIEYLSVSDLFAITIKQNPYEESVLKAEAWFRDRGFNPSDLNIYYHVFPGVQR